MTDPTLLTTARAELAEFDTLTHPLWCLDNLLQALKTDSRIPGAWGQLMRTEVETALTQVQVLRMTIMLHRAADEVVTAARAVNGTLMALNIRAAKARMHPIERQGLTVAGTQARQILRDIERLA